MVSQQRGLTDDEIAKLEIEEKAKRGLTDAEILSLEQKSAGKVTTKVTKPPWYDNYLGLIRPLLAGAQSGMAGTMSILDKAASFISKKTGIPKGDAFGIVSRDLNTYAEANRQRGVGGIPGKIAEGLGGAAIAIPELAILGPYGMAVHGGLRGAVEGGLPGAITGAVQGGLSQGVLKGTSGLSVPGRMGAGAAFGAATTPGGIGERVAGAGTMAGLGVMGGKKQPGVVDMRGKITPEQMAGAIKSGESKYSLDVPPEISAIVTKIKTEVLPKHKLLRIAQDIGYKKERGRRVVEAEEAWETVGGEAGFRAALDKLGSPLPKEHTDKIGESVTPAERDILVNFIKQSPILRGDFFGALNTVEAINKILTGDVLQKSEMKLLYEVFGKDIPEAILKQRPFWEKAKDLALESTNIPRAFMSTLDMSFGGRQGLYAAASHPVEFARAFSASFKLFGSERAWKALKENIVSDKDYPLARMAGVALTDIDNPFMEGREEPFRAGHLAEKIPIVGHTIRMSNRAYTGMANKLRMQMFKSYLDASEVGKKPGHARSNPQLAKEIAGLVNNMTGRGSLGKLEKNVSLLNLGLFAPRLMASRLKLITAPLSYIRADKQVRKEALASWFRFLGMGIVTTQAAKALFNADVNNEMTNPDYGKIRFGNTRIDPWGGFQQYFVKAAQFATGKTTSSMTGKVTKVGVGYKPLTRYEILTRFFESKESPLVSLFTDLAKGRTYTGEKVSLGKELSERFIPLYSSMLVQDALDLYKDNPEAMWAIIPAFFGFGAQTYAPKKTRY